MRLTENRQTLRAEDSEKEDPPPSTCATTVAKIPTQFLGFTPQGSPILRFSEEQQGQSLQVKPDQGVVIGRSEGQVIVAFRRGMTVVDGNGIGGENDGGGGGGGDGGDGGGGCAGVEPSRTPSPRPGPEVSVPARAGILRMTPVVRIATPPAVRGGESLV